MHFFLFDHPHFFPVATKATMLLPPPQKTPSMRILLFLLLLRLPLRLLFRYFVFSLCLRLLLPSLRLLHRRLFLILTHGAHGSQRFNEAAGMIDR